jgi:hypothetical protein
VIIYLITSLPSIIAATHHHHHLPTETMHPTLEFPIHPRENGPLVRWPPPALKNFIANVLAHPSSPLIPVISWFYGTPFVLLWIKVRLQSLWTGKPMLQSIVPTE